MIERNIEEMTPKEPVAEEPQESQNEESESTNTEGQKTNRRENWVFGRGAERELIWNKLEDWKNLLIKQELRLSKQTRVCAKLPLPADTAGNR